MAEKLASIKKIGGGDELGNLVVNTNNISVSGEVLLGTGRFIGLAFSRYSVVTYPYIQIYCRQGSTDIPVSDVVQTQTSTNFITNRNDLPYGDIILKHISGSTFTTTSCSLMYID